MGLRIAFVLIEAAIAENIGFSIRALKTMGFSDLRLVNCVDHFSSGTKKTAYGSHDLLEQVTRYESLKDAISDIELVIGTTAKNRVGRHDQYEPKQLKEIISQKSGALNSVAVVFGSEENGISNEDLKLCDLISTTPLAVDYPSLNLAQAVLIYAYELAGLQRERFEEVIGEREQKAVKEKAIHLLDSLKVTEHDSLYQRLIDRLMTANTSDIKLMLSLMRFLERKDGN